MAPQMCIRDRDGAVREYGNGLIGVAGHDLLDGIERTLAQLREALAVRDLEDVGMLEEIIEDVYKRQVYGAIELMTEVLVLFVLFLFAVLPFDRAGCFLWM